MTRREQIMLRWLLVLSGLALTIVAVAVWQDTVQNLRLAIARQQSKLASSTNSRSNQAAAQLQAAIKTLEDHVYAPANYGPLDYGRILREQAQLAGLAVAGLSLVTESPAGERWLLVLRGPAANQLVFLRRLIDQKIPHAIYSFGLQRRLGSQLEAKMEIGYVKPD